MLIEATLLVAKSLGMTTVAEGIETEGQLSALKSLYCDKGQGYLHSRFMTAENATDWLLKQAVTA